ncbi:putative ABC transport system ATP-binding protein [Algoriphagus chordae]|uniref:Putative ABC transport system ATP-binding protein n=2 Tax=Algoriphagus chordae TaxID=237019 RepID=A0A2W7QSN3_9BACT|nr:putative ABC transport system ATP-binding protein [Algoriphagus chordae]
MDFWAKGSVKVVKMAVLFRLYLCGLLVCGGITIFHQQSRGFAVKQLLNPFPTQVQHMNILSVSNLSKVYKSGSRKLTVLDEVTFDIKAGEIISIVGPSGSGKTTLLGLCAGLDSGSTGSVILDGNSLEKLSEDQRAAVRNQSVGFIFQNFQLLPTLTALENVMVPLELKKRKDARQKAQELLNKVGLGDRGTHYPTQLSGGEQQRVSIARAFANEPKILFADEPTGNLDTETGEMIEKLIFDLNKEEGTTLVLVTHDLELAAKTQRIIHIKGGKIQEGENA